jgi:GTP-binding protein HflX
MKTHVTYPVGADGANLVRRAFLVGVQPPGVDDDQANELLDELAELADTFGVDIAGRCVARITRPQAKYLIGEGKAQTIVDLARLNEADVIIFDDQLTPGQQRNWEKLADMAVIDREEVILDIFASRAHTREAVLQVQLARAHYDKPRLKRLWTHLSRQRGMGGGGGYGKGEGEQQIELDSRQLRNRITRLQEQLEEVQAQRGVQRRQRLRRPVPVAAIVGYTNAGKSSLLRSLTGADVLIEDKLFATLDPTVRRLVLPGESEALLVDTVGLIRKLPHQLVDAFRATLEETRLADVLVEVVDIRGRNIPEFHRTTRQVVEEIGAADKPVVMVFNKIDLVDDAFTLRRFRREWPGAIFVSTITGEGLEELRQELARACGSGLLEAELLIPHARYDVVALLHRGAARILQEKAGEDGVHLQVRVHPSLWSAIEPFLIPPPA